MELFDEFKQTVSVSYFCWSVKEKNPQQNKIQLHVSSFPVSLLLQTKEN